MSGKIACAALAQQLMLQFRTQVLVVGYQAECSPGCLDEFEARAQ